MPALSQRFPLTSLLLVCILSGVFLPSLASAEWVTLRPGMGQPYDVQVESLGGETTIRLRLHGYAREAVAEGESRFETISVPGLESSRTNGGPALPVVGVPVLLDRAAEIVAVEAVTVVEKGLVPTPFVARPKRCGGSFKERLACDTAIYNGEASFPQERAVIAQDGLLRGRRAVVVQLHPFRYLPQLRQLEVATELSVTLSAPLLSKGVRRLQAEPFEALFRGGFHQLLSPFRDEADAELLLLVVHDDLMGSVDDFVAWKESLGYLVEVMPLSEAGTSHTQLKATLQEAYDNWPIPPTYVLLVGDGNGLAKVPFVPSPYGCASDFLFSTLDGNDLYSDVLIGRVSAHNEAEAELQFAKAIWYERDVLTTGDGAWLPKAICISSSEGSGGSNDDVRSDVICDLQAEHGFDPAEKLYHSKNNDKAATISASIEAGRGWVTYLGHGSGHSWATTTPPYEVSHIQALENVFLLPFVVDISCSNGEFDSQSGDCFAETWMKSGTGAAPTAAVGIYSASTPTAWDEPAEMAVGMTKALLEQGVTNWAAVAAAGRSYMMDVLPGGGHEEVCHQYVVFGDPTLQLRTTVPRTLAVEHPAALPLGGFDFAVTVTSDGQPVNGASVTLATPGGTIVTAKTGASGQVTLLVEAGIVGTAKLTVAAANAVPYRADIETMVPGCGLLQASQAVSGCEAEWTVTLYDADLNADGQTKESVVVQAGSSSDPQGVSVTLQETSKDTGKFVGTLAVSGTAEGLTLQVAHGDTATITYNDEACGEGGGAKTFDVVIDCLPPDVEAVTFEEIGATEVTVALSLSEMASGEVQWGETKLLGESVPYANALAPAVVLSGLTPDTKYYVAVTATDVAGNSTTDDNGGIFYIVTTEACAPVCGGKQCGADGCGGTCGGCCEGQSCEDGQCVGGPGCVESGQPGCGGCACEDCVCDMDPYCCQVSWDDLCVDECLDQCGGCGAQAECDGKECGPNGCGGSCGDCPEGWDCTDGGQCVDNCEPECADKACGSDGCGGSCGECGETAFCVEGACLEECGDVTFVGCCDGTVQHYCEEGFQFVVDCAEQGLTCGWKASLGWYDCVAKQQGDPSGEFPMWCPGICPPECDGKECGPDGCGGTCGTCGASATCVNGQCENECTPQCDGKECGDDGCDGLCGECDMGLVCEGGVCQEGCVQQCLDRQCGDDGCGGSCGMCAPGMVCSAAGECVLAQDEQDATEGPDVVEEVAEPDRKKSGGCTAQPTPGSGAWLLLLLLLALGIRRRTSRA